MARFTAQQFLLCFFLLLTGFALNAQEPKWPEPKLSAATRMYMFKQAQAGDSTSIFPEYVYRLDTAQRVYVSNLVKVYPGFQEVALTAIGARAGTKAGLIWTVQVPLDKMNEFISLNGLQYIETDRPAAPALDTARRLTRVDSVHAGTYLPQAFSGHHVVTGIIDAGFDYTHPTLYDTGYSVYRVRRAWEEKNISGPAPAAFGYGSEFNDSLSIITRAHDISDGTHGTHVAGIAAGSGAGGPGGNNSRFRGMAYESDIVLVGIYPTAAYWLNTGMADMLDGMNYVFNYGDTLGEPAVANLSWGCPLGPHDGSSLFSQACDALTGPGKIFVLSAGNNGANKIHLQKTFTASDTSVSTICSFSSYLTDKKNWMDVWGDTSKTFCIRFSLYFGNNRVDSSLVFCLDDQTHQINLVGTNGDTCFITLTTVSSEFNLKPHMLIEAYSRVADRLRVTISGTDGTIDMWQGYVLQTSGYYGSFLSYGYPWAVNGDSYSTISDMATSRSAIAVGAYNSKTSFTNVSAQTLSYSGYVKGAIASFSSLGPTADGRTKPNITGPGLALASSVSSVDSTFWPSGIDYNTVVSQYVSPLNGQTYAYAMLAGTSMSGPAVSGIVSLLLEADPTLTPTQVMTILAQTAIVDNFTGVIPVNGSNTWGFGKVNAYRAIQQVLGVTGISHQENASLNCTVFPNPGDGNYQVAFGGEREEVLRVSVLDITGRELQMQNWNVIPGRNMLSLSLENLPAGVYFVNVAGQSGSTAVKIVKE